MYFKNYIILTGHRINWIWAFLTKVALESNKNEYELAKLII